MGSARDGVPDQEIWTIVATPGEIAGARHRACDLAVRYGADAEVQQAIALCVTEAVTNAIVHGYRDDPGGGAIEIETVRTAGGLCIYVRDDGSGLQANIDSPGLGLGLPFMAQLADQFELRTTNAGGTEVVLHFPLGA